MAKQAAQAMTQQEVMVVGPIQVRVAVAAMAAAVQVLASAHAAVQAVAAVAAVQAIGMITVQRMMRKMEPVDLQVKLALPLTPWAISWSPPPSN